ncbi:MAG: SDR family oxidoreductase [Ardenticatenaceae bacterium]|nr:SDR family oxidoreductase [Anaerolineales bacterium]MCB8941080.1 SDR family oxidoreductase [Ardenticatenaceae bacterium]MCB8972421.1 SDR family oxidoreductase [Ardenticatenaceae bacterium]
MPDTKKVVLITGASSGLGRACAAHLVSKGFTVFGTSRQPAEMPAGVQPIALDVTNDVSVEQAVTAVLAKAPRIDVLVNNAGMGVAGSLEETTIEEAKRQFEVNFFGAMRLCQQIIPVMRGQGNGRIVNISSLAGTIGLPFQALYSASKFALEGLSEALRLELEPFNIQVIVVQPGDFRTRFTASRRVVAAAQHSPVYGPRFATALQRYVSEENNGADPQLVAELLHRIILARSPRLSYRVGAWSQRFLVGLRPFLPDKLLIRLLASYYNL